MGSHSDLRYYCSRDDGWRRIIISISLYKQAFQWHLCILLLQEFLMNYGKGKHKCIYKLQNTIDDDLFLPRLFFWNTSITTTPCFFGAPFLFIKVVIKNRELKSYFSQALKRIKLQVCIGVYFTLCARKKQIEHRCKWLPLTLSHDSDSPRGRGVVAVGAAVSVMKSRRVSEARASPKWGPPCSIVIVIVYSAPKKDHKNIYRYRKWSIKRRYSNKRRSQISAALLINVF